MRATSVITVFLVFSTLSFAEGLTAAQQKKVEEQYNYCISAMTVHNDPRIDIKAYCEASKESLLEQLEGVQKQSKQMQALNLSTPVEICTKNVRVTGYGNTREARLNDALISAIQQAMGVHITADTFVKNGEITGDRVFSQTDGYIKAYSIVSEKADSIIVDVEVALKDMDYYTKEAKESQAKYALLNDMWEDQIALITEAYTKSTEDIRNIYSTRAESLLSAEAEKRMLYLNRLSSLDPSIFMDSAANRYTSEIEYTNQTYKEMQQALLHKGFDDNRISILNKKLGDIVNDYRQFVSAIDFDSDSFDADVQKLFDEYKRKYKIETGKGQ